MKPVTLREGIPWLRSITVRKALDWLRSVNRRGELEFLETDDMVSRDDPEKNLEILALRAALAELAPKDRAVLTLVDLEGHSMAEAAAILGSTRVAVKLRAVRARRKLTRMLVERAPISVGAAQTRS